MDLSAAPVAQIGLRHSTLTLSVNSTVNIQNLTNVLYSLSGSKDGFGLGKGYMRNIAGRIDGRCFHSGNFITIEWKGKRLHQAIFVIVAMFLLLLGCTILVSFASGIHGTNANSPFSDSLKTI
ncbi:hypothetical protein IGI04_001801 [Brassica rapa subsp. trilocularis]|uniref:Uncharacterized protein n=1 Tax=Brassica rapa subsp. trilocularis TaxID=1813537 RepID=A0ABQ7NTU6_BRACM|nr:hypothetical protein IGI04_001801 [Brassica rapa subsp. trilocularis]